MSMPSKPRLLKRLCALGLTAAMTVSLAAAPASAASTAPAIDSTDLEAVIAAMKKSADNPYGIDDESAFDLLSYVYLGWRTTGGTWQNQVIEDFFGSQMKDAGYILSDADLSWDGDAKDFFYIQHDDTSTQVFNPEYARFRIDSVTGADGKAVDAKDEPLLETAHRVLDQEMFAFDPTSDVYQAHYTALYGDALKKHGWNPKGSYASEQAKDDAFINAMWGWITEKNENGDRTHVFPEGTAVGASRGEEAELNLRAHLVGSTSFNATAEEQAAVAKDPANVSTLLKGQTGKVVYVGKVLNTGTREEPNYTTCDNEAVMALLAQDKDALKGAVLLCDSSHAANVGFAEHVGAISTMTYASLSGYHHPTMEETWYGAEDAAWYNDIAKRGGEEALTADVDEWYSDSARYTLRGAGADKALALMGKGTPVVEWNISKQQYVMLRELTETKGYTVNMNVATLGEFYPMNDAKNPDAKGQLTAIAEIKGTTYPNERVVFVGHVQEPSSNDNATGCSLTIELAIAMKEMIDNGILPRPERTMTFLIGDEMQFSSLYLNAHDGAEGHLNAGKPNLVDGDGKDGSGKIVCAINLDMVGEDPNKTGGPMRVEKCPDPSAYYEYTLDVTPGEDPYLDANGGHDGVFVRTPDSHTMWGAGDPENYDIGGNYLNDLYMAASNIAAGQMAKDGYEFQVDVCPFEGGSDHQKFLERGVPAVLTWHMTDFVYHTTVDTLYMSSAKELQSVGLTSLGTGYMMAHRSADATTKTMDILVEAAVARFASESENTQRHKKWADAEGADLSGELTQEKEVLNAWADWYVEAIQSCASYLTSDFDGYQAAEKMAMEKIEGLRSFALAYADQVFGGEGALSVSRAALVTALYQMEGSPDGGSAAFSDVSGDEWYGKAVAWASSNGVVTGTGAGFQPNGEITREALAVMLYRYAKLCGTDVSGAGQDFSGFQDGAAVSDWAAEAMGWAMGAGVLSGKDGRLAPAGTVTHAEASAALVQFLSL